MRKVERNFLKKIKGGVFAGPSIGAISSCTATANCKNGTTVSVTCYNEGAQCVGVDFNFKDPYQSNPLDGYVYCTTPGGFVKNNSCLTN